MSFGEEKTTRPERLFAHIAVHGLTLRSIAARLFCDDSETKTKNLFDPLLKQQRILAFRLSKSSKLKFYTLSARVAEKLGATKVRGRLSGLAVHTSVAVLCFCHAMDAPRAKVGLKTIKRIFGVELQRNWRTAIFVLQKTPVQYAARVIVPGPKAKPDYPLKCIREDAQVLLQLSSMRGHLKAGTFRFVVLVQSEARRDLFAEQLAVDRKLRRIPEDVRVDVVHVPDPSTLKISS